MTDPHTITVDRLKQFGAARYEDALDRMLAARVKDAEQRGTFLAGARVLDLTSGVEGVIVDRTAANAVPFGMVPVRLDRGDVVARFARDLMARPTPPSV